MGEPYLPTTRALSSSLPDGISMTSWRTGSGLEGGSEADVEIDIRDGGRLETQLSPPSDSPSKDPACPLMVELARLRLQIRERARAWPLP